MISAAHWMPWFLICFRAIARTRGQTLCAAVISSLPLCSGRESLSQELLESIYSGLRSLLDMGGTSAIYWSFSCFGRWMTLVGIAHVAFTREKVSAGRFHRLIHMWPAGRRGQLDCAGHSELPVNFNDSFVYLFPP